MSNNESPQPTPQPPGDIPPDYLHATIITCERVIVEKETNNVNIINAFTGLQVQYGVKESRKGLEDTEHLPLPAGHIFLRLLGSGPRKIPWTVFMRILTINGTNIPDAIVPIATGTYEPRLSLPFISQADAPIPFLGHGFKLTPERRKLIGEDGAIEIAIRYEAWTQSTFLGAHGITVKYTAIRAENNANDKTLPQETSKTP